MVGSFRLVVVVVVVVVAVARRSRLCCGGMIDGSFRLVVVVAVAVASVVVVAAIGIGRRTGGIISPSGGCFLLHDFIENCRRFWADKIIFSRTGCRGAIAALRLWLDRFLNNIERIEQTLLVHTG